MFIMKSNTCVCILSLVMVAFASSSKILFQELGLDNYRTISQHKSFLVKVLPEPDEKSPPKYS
jgi:hypothetical protein